MLFSFFYCIAGNFSIAFFCYVRMVLKGLAKMKTNLINYCFCIFFLQFIVLLAISQWSFCATYGLKRPCWTMWRWKPIFTVFRRNRKIRKITESSDTNHQYDRWGSYWNFIPLTARVRPVNHYGKYYRGILLTNYSEIQNKKGTNKRVGWEKISENHTYFLIWNLIVVWK